MVKLLIGEKGSGKTKKLLEAVNTALQESKGHVVCVEKDDLLRYQVSYRVRLLAAANYGISGYDAFYGFLSGLCAGDHDITDILIDATLKIGGRDYEALASFLERIARLSDLTGTVFTFTVSTARENLPERIEKICEIE
jgi:ABC-type phosphonate transport system ATPase subunit